MPVLYLLVALYVALYLTIWMHEVGHAVAYWKFGCKASPWKVRVPIYLFGSTPAPVNEDCASHLGSRQQVIVAVSGVAVNCLFGIPVLVALLLVGSLPAIPVLYVSLYGFAFAHLLEAGSYLVVNTLFLGSDMALLVEHAPRSRWPVLALASLILLPALAALVYEAPHVGDAVVGPARIASTWQLGAAALSVFLMGVMGLARVLASRAASVKG